MGQTPNLAIPYPEQSDPPDGAGQMQALATRVDNIVLGQVIADAKGDLLVGTGPDLIARLPVGADGAQLVADSAQTAGIKWLPLPTGGYVPVSLVDAKGDLLVGTADNAIARLGVGANGTVLAADSTQASGLTWRTVAGAGPTFTYGTTPPASPNDGDMWIFPADATNGVNWQFRYDAGSASASKWEYVGGPPLLSAVGATETTATASAWTNVATPGPIVTIPRAGDYMLQIQAMLFKTAADTNVQVAVGVGDFTATLFSVIGSVYASGAVVFPNATQRVAGIAASAALRLKYWQTAAGTMSVGNRTLLVTPVRVS